MLTDPPPNRSAVQDWIVAYIASVIDLEPGAITLDKTFHETGMDSAEVVIMTGVLEEEFAIETAAELPFEHPTIRRFLDALVEKGAISG